jgi:hypothetical protein
MMLAVTEALFDELGLDLLVFQPRVDMVRHLPQRLDTQFARKNLHAHSPSVLLSAVVATIGLGSTRSDSDTHKLPLKRTTFPPTFYGLSIAPCRPDRKRME